MDTLSGGYKAMKAANKVNNVKKDMEKKAKSVSESVKAKKVSRTSSTDIES